MSQENCPDIADVRRYLLGQLSPADGPPLEAHLLHCRDCAELAESLTAEDVLLDALRTQQAAVPDPDGDLIEQVIGRLKELGLSGTSSVSSDAATVAQGGSGPPAGPEAETDLPASATGSPRPRRAATDLPQIAGYEVQGELRRGGMGVVYRARQVGLNRTVALKMILAGAHAGQSLLTRFRAEAETVARLKHPHIVQIYEVGEAGGLPYCSLEFCDGGSLADRLRGAPLPAAEAAGVTEKLAGAMHAAHKVGVVHRDLKPSNVLLTADGSPKVTDFGLAKCLDAEDGQTRSGDILGTPSYMAPEQARGSLKEIGPHTDVYALGAILYEMLTGRPPFRTATVMETLDLVRQAEPVPPRQLQPRCPRDLEIVCLKCLRKEPDRRYATAQELADDLRRFRQGEPIRARPVGLLERAVKWVRRRPALASLSAVSILAVTAFLSLGFYFSARMGEARGALQAEEARTAAARQLAQSHEFFGLLRAVERRHARQEPGWSRDNLADLRKAAGMAPAAEQLAALREEAAAALGGLDVRRLERTERVKVLGQPFAVRCLAFDPRGRYLALGQERALGFMHCSVALIDLEGKGEPRLLSFAPAAVMQSLLKSSQEGITALAFSPDGRRLVAGTAYGELHAWDLSVEPPGHVVRPAHAERVERLAFTPDGSALFTGSRDKLAKRWSFPALEQTAVAELGGAVAGLDVHPTEGWICCTSERGTRFLSGDTLRPLRPDLATSLRCARFSPDGRCVLFGIDSGLHLLDLRTDRVVRSLAAPGEERAHDGEIRSVAFNADGSLILSVSRGNQVRLWETASGRLLADLPAAGPYPAAAFHPRPSGCPRSLAVAVGKEVRFYEIGGLREQTFLAGRPYPVTACALHPDGRSLACLSQSLVEGAGEVTVWPLESGGTASPEARYTLPGYDPSWPHRLAFHPASRALACARPNALTLLGQQGEKTLEPVPEDRALAFASCGRLWVAADLEVQRRELPDGRLTRKWSSKGVQILTGASDPLCVAAGDRWVAAGGDNGLVYLLSAADVCLSASPRAADTAVRSIAMNAEEGLVAAGSDRGELCLLRVPDGSVVAKATAHRDRVVALAFAGSRLLASGSRDRTVRLWRCEDGALEELMSLPMPGPVRWLGFHPDGVRLFVLLDRERAVRVWHLDGLRERLTSLGLGTGLGAIKRAELPPAVVPPPFCPPPAEAPEGPNGLRAELFADPYLRRCVKVRYDAQVNFDWGEGSPDPLVPGDFFSVRWTGWLKAPKPGRYTLRLEADDGARLWLDGRLLIDLWQGGVPKSHGVEVELTERPHEIRVEYFELTVTASVRLSWAQKDGFAREPVPPWALFHDRAAAAKVLVPGLRGP
jgi:WD40 repeat protein